MAETLAKPIEIRELSKIVSDSGLQLNEGEQIKQSYLPYFEQLAEVKEQASKINFTNPTELDEKIARELRLKTVKIRTGSESVKDERKKIHSLKANLEQSAWNLIKSTCQLEEEAFLQVEKRRENMERERIEAIKNERLQILIPLGFQGFNGMDLGRMDEEMFQSLKLGLETSKAAKEEAERKAEADRIAKEKAEAEERERMRVENERLKKEAEEKEKALELERQKVAKEKAALEAKAKAEREAAEKKLQAEREAKEKLEAEIKAKALAELRAKKEAEEKAAAELKAQQLAAKKAAAAPDKEKLLAFATMIDSINMPSLSSNEGKELLAATKILLDKTSKFIREKTNEL